MFLVGYTISYLLYTGYAAGITSFLASQGWHNSMTFDEVDRMKSKLEFHGEEYFFDFIEVPFVFPFFKN